LRVAQEFVTSLCDARANPGAKVQTLGIATDVSLGEDKKLDVLFLRLRAPHFHVIKRFRGIEDLGADSSDCDANHDFFLQSDRLPVATNRQP
jgi:hypothetical protein